MVDSRLYGGKIVAVALGLLQDVAWHQLLALDLAFEHPHPTVKFLSRHIRLHYSCPLPNHSHCAIFPAIKTPLNLWWKGSRRMGDKAAGVQHGPCVGGVSTLPV